jgi:hypothetical protein
MIKYSQCTDLCAITEAELNSWGEWPLAKKKTTTKALTALVPVRKSSLPQVKRMRPRNFCEAAAVLSMRAAEHGFRVVAQRIGGKRRCKKCKFIKTCRLRQCQP